MDCYRCKECKKTFDEFEMNYKEAQKDKKVLCEKCRTIEVDMKETKQQ